MKRFSNTWKSSKKPRNQRNYRSYAKLHIKQKFIHSHLSKELRNTYGKRNVSLRKGDKVKIMSGKFRKHQGKVENIDLKKSKILVSGVEITKKDGTKKLTPIKPSNVMVTELNLGDKLRDKYLARK